MVENGAMDGGMMNVEDLDREHSYWWIAKGLKKL
ncbi:MAG: hypothetical protein CM15mV67_410 [uncultured marine virus]|nr:MAG: hypothetical protein CM15mV67_410 [uncultured marine virus]